MRIMFAGGGTGGHIAPGIALAEAMLRLDSNLGFCFAVSGRNAEAHFFKGTGFRREIVDAPRSGGSPLSKAMLPVRLFMARARCREMLAKIRPDVVVGLGGYISVPVVMAAHSMKIPVYLIEQNALPGRATRFLAKKAREIFCQFDCSVQELKSRRARACLIGTPVRSDVLDSDRQAAAMALKLDPNVRTILVTGGSQGASGVNDLAISLLPRLERDYGLLQIIHQTGDEDYERVAAAYAEYRIESRVMRFVNPMSAALQAADFVIARAGATGIAEITALGLASILVPYPNALSLDGEQHKNARQLVDNKAAYVVEENSPDAPEEIFQALSSLLDDADCAREMGYNAAKMGFPCAADDIAAIIFHSLGKEKIKQSAKSSDEKPEREPVGAA